MLASGKAAHSFFSLMQLYVYILHTINNYIE